MGEWSDPVEGKDKTSHERKARKIYRFVKVKSMGLGLSVFVKRKWV